MSGELIRNDDGHRERSPHSRKLKGVGVLIQHQIFNSTIESMKSTRKRGGTVPIIIDGKGENPSEWISVEYEIFQYKGNSPVDGLGKDF